jgi:polyphosphate kinase
VSETIRVRSIVGRFLEHTRIFAFHAAGEEKVYLASADWMGRNLYRRVETCFPIEDAALKARVLDEGLERYLGDNVGAWVMAADGTSAPLEPDEGEPRRSAQEQLLARLAET